MGDDDEAAQAEQVGAAVRVRVEPRAQPPRGRPDQEPAELPARRVGDLLAEGLERRRIVPSSSFSDMFP